MSEKWIEELQQKVADCWEWHSPAVQIGFRYARPDEDDDFWEIWAYPAVQEIVGGKEDGETVWSGFNFDIHEFMTKFEPEAVALSTRQHEATDSASSTLQIIRSHFQSLMQSVTGGDSDAIARHKPANYQN